MKRFINLLKCLLYGHFWEHWQNPEEWLVIVVCHTCGKTLIFKK